MGRVGCEGRMAVGPGRLGGMAESCLWESCRKGRGGGQSAAKGGWSGLGGLTCLWTLVRI